MLLETVIKNLIFLEAPKRMHLNWRVRKLSPGGKKKVKEIKCTSEMKQIPLDSFVWTFLLHKFVQNIFIHSYMCLYFKYNLHSTNKSADPPSANPHLFLAIVPDNRRLRMAFHFNCVKLFWKSVSLSFCTPSSFFMIFFLLPVFVNDSFSTRPYLFEWQPFNVDFYCALYRHKLPRQMRRRKTFYGNI